MSTYKFNESKDSFNSLVFLQPVDQQYDSKREKRSYKSIMAKIADDTYECGKPEILNISTDSEAEIFGNTYFTSTSSPMPFHREEHKSLSINDLLRTPMGKLSLFKKKEYKMTQLLKPDWKENIGYQVFKTYIKAKLLIEYNNQKSNGNDCSNDNNNDNSSGNILVNRHRC